MIIHELIIKRPLKYLWLKKIDDVDLSKHCARCLVGEYVERVNVMDEHYENIVLPKCMFYLCGVAIPIIWENNIHLAFQYSEGENVLIDNDFYKINIQNARVIEISNDYIDQDLPQSRYKKFNTCRNWWFANWFKKNK